MKQEPVVPPPRNPARWAAALAAALVAGALVWAQFRGLDLFDAATHFLTYQFPADNPDTHTHYHLFARPLWLLCGGHIVAFRLLCLALLSGAAWVFWRAWRGVLAPSADDPWTGLALWLAVLAGLGWLPVLLGYNSFSTFFALLALAALAPALALVPGSPARPARRIAAAFAFVALVGLTALVKPPAALGLAAWGGFLAWVLLPLPRFWRVLPLVIGAAALTAVLFFAAHWTEQTASDPTALIQFAGLKLRPEWVLGSLQRYGRELAAFLPLLAGDLSWAALPALALAVAVIARARRPGLPARWVDPLAAAILASFVALGAVRGLWDGSFFRAITGEMARLYLVLWAGLLPGWLAAWRCAPGEHTRSGCVALACLFLPLTCGLGSTNTLYFSALHWTVFWTAGLLIVARAISRELVAPAFHRGFTVVLGLAAAAHLWSGHFLRPYMHQPPLWEQDVPVAVGHPATTLRLDATTAGFVREVRAIFDRGGYEPGDDVFGFFNVPGLVHAVGARSPGAPWYFGTWYHGDDTDGGKIRAVPAERRRRAWILSHGTLTAFQREFLNCGIDFPAGYEKIGQTTNPASGLEIGIWKPKSRP